MAPAPAMPSPMNEDQVQSFHSGRVSGCVTLQAPNPTSSTCSRNSPVRMARATSPICTIRVFVIVSLRKEVGRPGGTRTPNMRFWRPPLYHWSYWPGSQPGYLVSLWSVCLRHRGQNFGLTSLSVMVRLFLVVVELLSLQTLHSSVMIVRFIPSPFGGWSPPPGLNW